MSVAASPQKPFRSGGPARRFVKGRTCTRGLTQRREDAKKDKRKGVLSPRALQETPGFPSTGRLRIPELFPHELHDRRAVRQQVYRSGGPACL